MGYEVEVKFRVADLTEIRARIAARDVEPEATVDHEDIYFAHPSRDFATTGEAFRIRGEGDRNLITYKGAKLTGPAKSREEIEVEFAAGHAIRDDLKTIYGRLGFQPVATVRKRRTSYHLMITGRAITVTLDETESVGTFAEVETLIADQTDLSTAQDAVIQLGAELGLTDVEPRSYLRLLLETDGILPANRSGQT